MRLGRPDRRRNGLDKVNLSEKQLFETTVKEAKDRVSELFPKWHQEKTEKMSGQNVLIFRKELDS